MEVALWAMKAARVGLPQLIEWPAAWAQIKVLQIAGEINSDHFKPVFTVTQQAVSKETNIKQQNIEDCLQQKYNSTVLKNYLEYTCTFLECALHIQHKPSDYSLTGETSQKTWVAWNGLVLTLLLLHHHCHEKHHWLLLFAVRFHIKLGGCPTVGKISELLVPQHLSLSLFLNNLVMGNLLKETSGNVNTHIDSGLAFCHLWQAKGSFAQPQKQS